MVERRTAVPGGVAVALVAVLAVVHATSPVVAVTDMFFDAFIPLDAGWRVACGQVPHVDFRSPVGPVYAWAFGAALAGGASGHALVGVPAAIAVPIAGLAWALGDALHPWIRAAVAATAGLLALSPATLDTGEIAHLALYNRASWALLVALAAGIAPAERTAGARLARGALGGLALGALIGIKVTLAAAGAGLIALWALWGSRRDVAVALGAPAVGWAAFAALSPIPTAYAADVAFAIAASGGSAGQGTVAEKLWDEALANAPATIALGLALGLLARAEDRARAARYAAAGVATAFGGMFVAAQSHDVHVPLVAAGFVITAEGCRRLVAGVAGALPLIAALALLVIRADHDLNGVVRHRWLAAQDDRLWAVTGDARSPAASLRFVGESHAEPVEPARNGVEPSVAALAAMVIEGERALAAHARPDDTVLALMFSNPFPVARRAPPPRDTSLWFDVDRTFGERAPLTAADLADVDVVIVPVVPPSEDTPAMRGMLEPVLLELGWERIGTPLWVLWRRNGSPR